jgi:L,D-transpeptidase ErfK/SrfK
MTNRSLCLALALCLFAGPLSAFERAWPVEEDVDVVGELSHVEATYEDTLIDVARRHQVGFEAIRRANPELNTWIPGENARILLPHQFVLPDARRQDIVINLPEMRLYYFPLGESRVVTYPVSIGRMDWGTPVGTLDVIEKRENPTWTPPDSIRKAYAERGEALPRVVAPGPDNPMGEYAIRLSRPSYLIHGTNWSTGIGIRSTHGCIRMDNDDIGELYPRVSLGASVNIVNQPIKVGWRDGMLYLEVHPPLEELEDQAQGMDQAVTKVMEAVGERDARVDWQRVRRAIDELTGVPQVIGWDIDQARTTSTSATSTASAEPPTADP